MDSNDTKSSDAGEIRDEAAVFEQLVPLIELETEPQTAIGSGSARLLTTLGIGSLWCGGALVLESYFSLPWQVAKAAEILAGMGFTPGVFAMGGLALMGMGRIGKSLAKLAERPRLTDMGMVDAVEGATDQVAELTSSFSTLLDQVAVLSERESFVTVNAPAPDEDLVQLYRDQKDAVFQLAAGLDKLGRRLGSDVIGEIQNLNMRLDEIEGTLFARFETCIRSSEAQMSALMKAELATLAAAIEKPEPQLESQQPREVVQPTIEERTDEFVTAKLEQFMEIAPDESERGERTAETEEALEESNPPESNAPQVVVDEDIDLEETSITEFADLSQVVVSEVSEFAESIGEDIESEPSAPIEVRLEDPHPELEPEVSPLAFLDGLKSIAPASQDPHSPSVKAPLLDFDSLDEPAAALPRKPLPKNERTSKN